MYCALTIILWYAYNNTVYWSTQCCYLHTVHSSTVLQAKSDSDVMFCLQSYQGLKTDRSLVY